MDVIFIPKHMIRKRLQCVNIVSLIIQYHTGNVYCGAVLTVHVLGGELIKINQYVGNLDFLKLRAG